ncbi:DUF502 domain-containing protein [Magnetospirillum fulvum]|uniref:Uncharacterized membrane protein n=1 Tax=Magnetospirillum fulvum TaxID=1082 RepID=A0A1H6HTJ3_MAGFU|nr:DUF502 domain-containing protein [Magnetospirillum fulvum]SEH37454.1 Uncharacterized membrane protein [Magnetospirillum fulvum]
MSPQPDPAVSRPDESSAGLVARLRANFLAGLLVAAPISLTVYIVWAVISFIDTQVSSLFPPSWGLSHYLPGFGVLLALVGLTAVGALTANIAGRLVLAVSESLLGRMPVIRSIYAAIKQVVHTVLAQKAEAFREVVLLEYPRPGLWTLAFITGTTNGEVRACFDEEMVNVFVPTTPNPTSGFLLFVPRRSVRLLSISVEDALKMVVSTGILTPDDVVAGAGTTPPPLAAAIDGGGGGA